MLLSGATKFFCSVILGELKTFRNYRGCRYYFSKTFRADSSLHHILESENFRFAFSKKISVTWVVKYEKLNFRKSFVGNLLVR